MSIAALNWAFSLRGVSISQKVVLISLANFSDESGYSFPAIKTIAEMSCMSESSVRRALADLCDRQILRIDHRFRADGSQTSSGYFLGLTPPVNLTPPPSTVTPPPVTADTPYNHQITTTITDDKSSVVKTRGTRLKSDWQPSEHDREKAAEIGLTQEQIQNEADRFRDYWVSASGSKATKHDWSATWRNWCRSAKDRRGSPLRVVASGNQSKSGSRLDAALRALEEAKSSGSRW